MQRTLVDKLRARRQHALHAAAARSDATESAAVQSTSSSSSQPAGVIIHPQDRDLGSTMVITCMQLIIFSR